MMKTLSTLFACLLLVPSLLSAAPPELEKLTLKTLPPVEVPAVSAPFRYTQAYGTYDWSGLPAYVFTEEDSLSAPIIEAIKRTNSTIDVALYNLQIPETAEALIAAHNRGVKVRAIFNYRHVHPKTGPQIQAIMDSGIETRIVKGLGNGTMHCKYAIFDGTLLQAGSANWSGWAQDYSYENIMFTVQREHISGYGDNFEWMWNWSRPSDDLSAKLPAFTPPPSDPTPYLAFNGTYLPDYVFSPKGGTEATVVRAIDAAREEVDVAMFTFTSRKLMDALLRAADRGVDVKLMAFAGQRFPFFTEVKSSRINLRFKKGRGLDRGQMHNKFAVLDGKLLINGSYNWTNMGEHSNTEATILTTLPTYVQPYKAEFDKLFSTAKE